MDNLAVRAVLNKLLAIEERISLLDPVRDEAIIHELRREELELQHHFDVLIPA